MTDRSAPRLSKWPFYVADAVLLGLAAWIVYHYPHPLAPWAGALVAACVGLAALLSVWPYRLEYETEVKQFEAERLTDAVSTLQNLEQVGSDIRQATSQWQGVHEQASRTTEATRAIADRMTAEARAFSEFMAKANESEKATLRLEVEKLRRGEGQWLQVLVHMLDHVHALYKAGQRSGQPNLVTQLTTFQAACRDLGRRIGLTAVDAEVDEDFDGGRHEVMQGQVVPEGPNRIAQVIAPGYSFQGQAIRKPIVVLKAAGESEAAAPAEPTDTGDATPADEPRVEPSDELPLKVVSPSPETDDGQAPLPLHG